MQHFAALARSSPWRWHSLRITVAWHGRLRREPVRGWVRRPDCLRVEDLAGAVLQSGRQGPASVAMLSSAGPAGGSPPDPSAGSAGSPQLDDAGLVLRRPWAPGVRYDDPMYLDYRWVAMLDPAELADGTGPWPGEPGPVPVEIQQLSEVDHHGRLAWEANLRTTDAYDPRCSCCPLLFGAHSERLEAAEGAVTLRERNPQLRYPDAHRVRLDVASGICVLTEELGGSHAGTGHEVRVEAVDEELPDDLFRPDSGSIGVESRRRWLSRPHRERRGGRRLR